jgi:tetratricopeptide (TPR) repeat protein
VSIGKEKVSIENNPDEKELWASIPRSEGVDRAEHFVKLSHMAYDRGDFKSALALCESARDIYESQKAIVSTQELLHVYEGITWSLRKLDREKEAAELALHAVEILKEDSPVDATEMLREAGRFFFTAGEYQKSLDCHLKAMQEIDPDITEFTMGIDNYNVGFALMKLEKYSEAIPHLLKAREYFKKDKEPEKVFYCDEYLAVCYIELKNGVEATVHAQKALDFAITAQNNSLETWAKYRLGCAKVLLAELDEAENLLRDSLGMNSRTGFPDWDLTIEIEKEIANILTIKGRVTEADEIRRRIKTLEETVKGE